MRPEYGMTVHTRGGGTDVEEPFEKPMILPENEDSDPARHAWADARFATDIMSEHGLFFALLMPPEVANQERTQALQFASDFAALHKRIAGTSPPDPGDLKRFTAEVVEAVKPFIEYKATLGDAQRNGTLRSLVWPLFFDHTRHEAERWTRRLEQLGRGESGFDPGRGRSVLEQHHGGARAIRCPPARSRRVRIGGEGHPGQQCVPRARIRRDRGGGSRPRGREPGTVVSALSEHPETSAVLSAAETILEFKTQAARDIEAARITSIIDPPLSDHVRREAFKFVDELKRAVSPLTRGR
jgi:Domain of unknown function (DUF2935)